MRRALSVLYAAFLAVVLAAYFRQTPIPFFWSRFYAFAFVTGALAASTSAGLWVLRCFGCSPRSWAEKTALSGALGLGFLSLGLFFLGVLGWLTLQASILLLTALAMLGIKDVSAFIRETKKTFRNRPPTGVMASGLGLGIAAAACLAPPHYYDALVYHLALPDLYARLGKIAFVPFNLYSHFPQGMEMLFTLALLAGSDTAAHLFSWVMAVIAVFGAYGMGRRFLSASSAGLACALLGAMPAFLLLGSGAYVETGSAAFVSLSAFCFAVWWEEEKDGWLALAALLSGFGMAVKYTGVITPAVLTVGLTIKACDRSVPFARTSRRIFLFGALAAVPILPWLLKNWVIVGNPLFPFLYKTFGSGPIPWGQESAAGYFTWITEYGRTGHWVEELVLFPWRVITEGLRYGGGFDVLGDHGWLPFLLGLPSLFFLRGISKMARVLAGYLVCHFLIWFATAQVLRFLVPLAPVGAVLVALGVERAGAKLGPLFHRILMGCLAFVLLSQMALFFYVEGVFGIEGTVSGVESRNEYLRRKLPYFEAYQAVNRDESVRKMMIVGEQRGYYCEKPYIATTAFAPNPFVMWAEEARDPAELSERMRREGVSHILLVPGEGQRLQDGYRIFSWTPEGKKRWEGFLNKECRLTLSTPGALLFAVNDEPRSRRGG